MSATNTSAITAALAQYSTCDVSDALCKLDYPNGGFLSGISMWSPQRQDGNTKIVGPVHTVKYALLNDPTPALASHYIDSVPKGSVLFISSPHENPNAVFGGLMAIRAKFRGAVGCVVDGMFRDLQEQKDAKFPLFARDIGTAPPYSFVKVVGIDVAIHVRSNGQDFEISPQDYIIADLNGVVFLPAHHAEEVLLIVKKMQAADAKVAAALKEGMPFAEASEKFR